MSKLTMQVITVNVSNDFAAGFGSPPGAFGQWWRDFVSYGKRIRGLKVVKMTTGLNVDFYFGPSNQNATSAIPISVGDLWEDDSADPNKWYNDGVGYGVTAGTTVPIGSSFVVAIYQ